MKASVTKNIKCFLQQDNLGIDQLFFIFQLQKTFQHISILFKCANKLVIQRLILLINLSRMAVFLNLQQENVYLFATLKACSRTESSCEKQLASGLQSRGTLVCSVLFFIPVPFFYTLMLKIGNE